MAEEKRTRYFTNEMKKWYQYQQKVRDLPNRDSNQSDASLAEKMEHHYQKTMARSNLGKQLKKCFNILTGKDDSRDIYVGAIRVGINLNNHLAIDSLRLAINKLNVHPQPSVPSTCWTYSLSLCGILFIKIYSSWNNYLLRGIFPNDQYSRD